MLGAGDEWFYRGLLGIDVDRSRSAALIVKPEIVEGVDWVKGSYESSLGMVEVEWKREGVKVELEVTVPVGAVVRVPLRVGDAVSFGDREEGVMRLRMDGDGVVYRVAAGRHRFVMIPM